MVLLGKSWYHLEEKMYGHDILERNHPICDALLISNNKVQQTGESESL